MSGLGDGSLVEVQVALGGGERAVAGDLAEVVQGDAGVGHPGQPGVAKVVAAEPVKAQGGDDVVPVGGVAQDRGGDPPAAGADEKPAIRSCGGQGEAAFDQGPDLGDQGHDAGAFALGAFVDQPARGGGGLAADGPEPPLGVVSTARQPETSPMRAAVAAANTTMSPQPR